MALWMGVLALECVEATTPAVRMLGRSAAESLVGPMLQQLARMLPVEFDYGFCWAAAVFDPAQLLRRDFPVHRELGEFYASARRDGTAMGQSVSLTQHQGRMPSALLAPDPALGAGTLLTIPVVLCGSEAAIAAAAERLESDLYGEGLADAAIVLELAADLAVRFEHVRWMSMLDLAAMMAAQLEHVGLGAAWTLIEEWLYAQAPRDLQVESALGQRLQLRANRIHLQFQAFSVYAQHAIAAGHAVHLSDYLARVHEFRQMQALFSAHAIAVATALPQADSEHVCSRQMDDFVIEQLGSGEAVGYVLQSHPALGALAWTGVDAQGSILEHRYPLSPDAIGRFQAQLDARRIPVQRPGSISLTADGLDLGLPGTQGCGRH